MCTVVSIASFHNDNFGILLDFRYTGKGRSTVKSCITMVDAEAGAADRHRMSAS